MEPTADAGQEASPDNATWTARAGLVGQPGVVVDETDGRRDLWCFDPESPIITDRPLDWLGFGGQPFSIEFADGQVVVTNDLNHLGTIPAGSHDQFPPNAAITGLPDGDTYEARYADAAGHNLRLVTATSPAESFTVASRMSGTGDQVDVTRIDGDGRRELLASFAGGKALPQDRARSGPQRASPAASGSGVPITLDFPAALTHVPARPDTGQPGRRAGVPTTARTRAAGVGATGPRLG
jgi:hypothetical protein